MKQKNTLLIIEDDPGIQSQLRWSFDDYHVVTAVDRETALAQFRRHEPSVVTLDMGLPPDPGGTSEGLKLLEEMISVLPHTKVIVVTGNDDRASAVRAVALGAYDFYLKPIDPDLLNLIVRRAFQLFELEHENERLSQLEQGSSFHGLVCDSTNMMNVCNTVEKVAPTDVSCLLLGESGTGKEVLAKALHRLSPRRDAPFVAINCAAIPENLLESELFGYEKGAFTGAARQSMGKFELANGGTLFLDEIGDLPLSLQAKLLRFLQERVIERVGGLEPINIDVRIVCATHCDLENMIQLGTFREDLYYRLSELVIRIPALRERDGDAVMIARTLLERFVAQQKRKIKGFTQEALLAIEAYSWPGNVRELENRLKRAVIMAEGNQISAADLELESVDEENILPFNLRVVREDAERRAVVRALNYTSNNIARASELLGVSRPTLYDLMKKLNIES